MAANLWRPTYVKVIYMSPKADIKLANILLVFSSLPFPATFLLRVQTIIMKPGPSCSKTRQWSPPNAIGFPNTYPLDSDLSCGERYPTFDQPRPQYSSQIVETQTVSLELSRKFLTFSLHTFPLTQMCPSPSPMLSHAYFKALRRL